MQVFRLILTLLGWLLRVKYLRFWVVVVYSKRLDLKGGLRLKERSCCELLLSEGFLERFGTNETIIDVVEVGGELIDGSFLVI